MKNVSISLMIAGLVMLLITGFSFITKKKIVDAGAGTIGDGDDADPCHDAHPTGATSTASDIGMSYAWR